MNLAHPLTGGYWGQVLADLHPFEGRAAHAAQITCAAVVVAAVMLTFRMPFLSIGPYLVFLLAQPGTLMTRAAGLLGFFAALSTFLLMWAVATLAWDTAWLRIVLWTAIFYGGYYLVQILAEPRLVWGPLVMTSLLAPSFDQIHNPNALLSMLGWLWAILGLVLVATFSFEWLLRPSRPEDFSAKALHELQQPGGFIAKDWWTNPAHGAFARRATAATMGCYLFLSLADWDGIHTCMITCVVTGLSGTGAQMHKQRLRFLGALLGGAVGIGAALWVVPQLTNVGGFLLLLAVGSFLAAWVSLGSERISYAGWQFALAFFMVLLQEPHPVTSLDTIRDRWVGIFVGIFAMRLAFVWISPWPWGESPSESSPHQPSR